MFRFLKKDHHTVTVSPASIIFFVFFVLLLYFLYYIRFILTLLFLSFIIMVALNPIVRKFERRLRLSRVLSIVIVYFLVLAVIAGLLGLLIPPLVSQMQQLVGLLSLPWLQDELKNFTFTISELGAILERVGSSLGMIFSIVTSTFSGIFTVFTLLVMSFYLMIDRHNLHLKIGWFTKDKKHIVAAKQFLTSLEEQLGGWVRGQIILSLVIGTVIYASLSLLSIEYALPLALLAAFLEILPNLGPTIASVPAIIIAWVTMGPAMAGAIVLLYIVVQQLENNFLVPKVMKDNADVSPLISIVSILIGLQVGGVVGALLAVPTYIVFRTVYGKWLREWMM